MKWKIRLPEMINVCDARSVANEIELSWLKRKPLYYFFNREDERIKKLKWGQMHIKISICLLMLAILFLILSFCLYDSNNNGLLNWWSNAFMSLGTGLFAGWTLYVLTNIRIRCESDINQRLSDVMVLYNLGKKVYDIYSFYVTYNLLTPEMKSECDHNKEFSNAFMAAYKYVENMPKLGNRKILKTEFNFDYDKTKEKLEKMSAEITYELTYIDARKYIKEIISLIESSYALVEECKKDCETEKTIIKKIPF